ncbi:hypothetical protein, partial [Acinetobacter baumannii]
REIINRFCAFYINSIDDYKGEMEDYLAEALLKINVMPQHDIDTMMIDFIKSMSLNFKIFGKNSFRKSIARNPNQRTVLNVSLFDTISTCFALNWSKLEKLDHIMLKDKLIFLLQYPPFYDSITLSTNNTYNIRYRHQLVNKVFGHDLDKTCVQNIIEFELSHFNTSIDNEMVESLVKCYENIAMSSAPFNERYSLFNNEFENIFMKYNFKYYPRNIFLLFECMFGEYKSSVDI